MFVIATTSIFVIFFLILGVGVQLAKFHWRHWRDQNLHFFFLIVKHDRSISLMTYPSPRFSCFRWRSSIIGSYLILACQLDAGASYWHLFFRFQKLSIGIDSYNQLVGLLLWFRVPPFVRYDRNDGSLELLTFADLLVGSSRGTFSWRQRYTQSALIEPCPSILIDEYSN